MPLNHTRRRFAVYALMALLASLSIAISTVRADEVTPVVPYHFDENLISSGWTLRLNGGANLTVFPNVLTAPADVSWSESSDAVPILPESTAQLGSLYRLTITGVTELNTAQWKLAVVLPDTRSYWSKSVWMYDLNTKTWAKLSTKRNPVTGKLQAGINTLDSYVVVLEDQTTELGDATWYCKYSCSSRYPKLHATSNDFPVGSYVTVTNPLNKATVTVKIVSGWGQPEGRIIDLSWAAYAKLKPTNTGVTAVIVRPKGSAEPVASIIPAKTVKTETIPALSVTALNKSSAPVVTANAYRVLDVSTGTVLAEKKSDIMLPVASITKLMTGVVFLDSNPDLKATFIYSQSDGTGSDINGHAYGYNNLSLRPGDKVKNRDLFYATLVGSANNGATALVRASGLTRQEFVSRMNAKAKEWGMTDTLFVEPSGLDPGNISSARDIAILGNRAFHDYEPIRFVTTKKTYTFVASLSGKHMVKNTDKLLSQNNGLYVTGGKTGFIDEAKYTYVVRTKNTQGAQIIVSLLGANSSSVRFNEAATLAKWAWTNFTWS